MARGLSDLQKNILILAYDNRDTHPFLLPGHVLANVYGLELQADGRRFDRQRAGDRYAAVNVAVSKAFTRLEKRGLMETVFVNGFTRKMFAHGQVRYYNRGMKLTSDGIQIAERLLGKTPLTFVLPNREADDEPD
jgi:hypothetical protein